MTPRVNFNNHEEFVAMLMVDMGFTGDYIQRMTNLSKGRLEYRKRKTGFKTTLYRRGESTFARMLMSRILSPQPQQAAGGVRRRFAQQTPVVADVNDVDAETFKSEVRRRLEPFNPRTDRPSVPGRPEAR